MIDKLSFRWLGRWWYNPLNSIAKEIKEMATFWTSIGIMLIPVGLVILIRWPNFYPTVFIVMLVGVILGVVGLRFTIRDEKQKHLETELRIRKEKVFLQVLLHTAGKLGVDLGELIKEVEKGDE